MPPILANVYLHYVLDLWFGKAIKRLAQGCAGIVRYADDFIYCFKYVKDAKELIMLLRERLQKFGLKHAKEKSRIIEFGRFAVANSKRDVGNGLSIAGLVLLTHSHEGCWRV